MQFNKLNKGNRFIFVLLLSALYFPFFSHLDSLPIDQYDEAFFALRAYHIAETGVPMKKFGVFDEMDNRSNSKPPLFSYVQALSYKLFGYNELALRLPVALAGFFTCLFLIYFINRDFEDLYAGFFAAMVLCTSVGFVGDHMARWGDQDVPFALCVFLFVYQYFIFIKTEKVKPLAFAVFWFVCAFLIKSVAVFMVLPGVLLYSLLQKEIREKIRQHAKWILLIAIMLIVVFLIIPFLLKDDFILGLGNWSRFTDIHGENHRHYFWFYFDIWNVRGYFRPWLFILPLSIFPIIFESKQKPFILYLWVVSVIQWLILSMAQTKIPHYAAPIFIIHAVIVGLTLGFFYKHAAGYLQKRFSMKPFLFFLIFTVLFFSIPYKIIIKKVVQMNEGDERHIFGYFVNRNPEYKKITMIYEGVNVSNTYYINVYNKHKGYEIERREQIDRNIEVGSAVMVCRDLQMKALEQIFEVEEVDERLGCKMLLVKARKSSNKR